MKNLHDDLCRKVADQKAWIDRCGGTLDGYVARYGDPGIPPRDRHGNFKTLYIPPDKKHIAGKLTPVPGEPNTYYQLHSGNGGTAIYKADTDALDRLEQELRKYESKYRS